MQRYFASEKTNNLFMLKDTDMHHIKNVMRFKDGTKIEVVYDKKLYHANIENNKIIEIELIEEFSEEKFQVNLIVPLLKEQKLDYILQKATELGVNTITLINTERSVIKLENSKVDKKLTRWNMIAKEAAEQSKRLDIPNIIYMEKLKDITGTNLICLPNSDISIKNYLKTNPIYDKLNVMIGPEGGFSKKEEEYYKNMGFYSVSLGSRIMRAETVPLFIMSVLNYEYMEWFYEYF